MEKHIDDVAKYNIERWQSLAQAKAIFTRPRLDLDKDSARNYLDPRGILGDLAGKTVLCLAAGGGQQSTAFALLGADVTVIDISEAQLERDAEAAVHYNLKIKALQGDMRDLSRFAKDTFDIVYHPYSLNFVPNASAVFSQAGRVLRAGGIYHFMCANPFFMGLGAKDWSRGDGGGYALKLPYVNGAEVTYKDESWVYGGENPDEPVKECKEYRHTLGTLVNGLIEQGFIILNVWEQNLGAPESEPEPGTEAHFSSVAPPWLIFWAIYRPDVLKK